MRRSHFCTIFHGNPSTTVDVETFHSRHFTTSWRCCRESQGVAKVIKIHHLGTMKVFTKYPSIYLSLDHTGGLTDLLAWFEIYVNGEYMLVQISLPRTHFSLDKSRVQRRQYSSLSKDASFITGCSQLYISA